MSAEGQSYIVGQGPALGAGAVIGLTLAGLPHHAVWPRNLALALASAVLVGGVWLSMRRGPEAALRRNDLRARRERLFSESDDARRLSTRGAHRGRDYAAKRGRLWRRWKGVYAELDCGAAR